METLAGRNLWREDPAALEAVVLAELQEIDTEISGLKIIYEPQAEQCVMCIKFSDKAKTLDPILMSAELLDDGEPPDVAKVLYTFYEMQRDSGE